jgi:dTDP-4-amino-4,6-dideoxygalactose transaminase
MPRLGKGKKTMSKRIFLSPPWMGGDERALVDEAFASNYIAPCGPMVDRFEREFAEVVGLPYACALSSGTAALELLFHELSVGAGDTVFCSDLTFVASIAPAVHRGAVPVFIDCDAATWTMDPNVLEKALAEAAKEGRLPKAVVAADLYGQCCDYERIEAVCATYGVPLIIDAAEALGAVYGSSKVLECGNSKVLECGNSKVEKVGEGKGFRTLELSNSQTSLRHAGQAGMATVYSFNGNKIITTSGGGMLAANDGDVVERARKRSQQAREPVIWYEHEELGYNHRMSNIVAAIGVGQLAYLERIIQKKRQIFEWYRERLGMRVGFMPEAAYGQCTRWLTVMEVRGAELGVRSGVGRRESGVGGPSETVEHLRLALEAEDIESRPVWKPMHLQPVFRGAKMYGGEVSERLFANGLCLPSGAGLTEGEVERVCRIVALALPSR